MFSNGAHTLVLQLLVSLLIWVVLASQLLELSSYLFWLMEGSNKNAKINIIESRMGNY